MSWQASLVCWQIEGVSLAAPPRWCRLQAAATPQCALVLLTVWPDVLSPPPPCEWPQWGRPVKYMQRRHAPGTADSS